MAGQENRHFLNRDARHLKKPLGDIAGLTKLGFHLIGVLIGSASCALQQHLCEEECGYILEGTGTACIGDKVLQVEAGVLLPIWLGARRRTCAIPDPTY